jgi:hypothetical protein
MKIGPRPVNVLMCHACSLILDLALWKVGIAVAVYLLIASVCESGCTDDYCIGLNPMQCMSRDILWEEETDPTRLHPD